MAAATVIHLPVFQRFDCHSCAYCCRNLVVNVGEADRKRILAAGWQERLSGQSLFTEYSLGRRRLWRLAKQPNGDCVFLRSDNFCRLHAETGAASKPLACRAYPFSLTPGADGVHLDLRLDCPSVASNEGRTLGTHLAEIQRLAREAEVTEAASSMPVWRRGQRTLSSDEFLAVVAAFETVLNSAGPLRQRLHAACALLDLLYEIRVDKVHGLRFIEMMQLLAGACLEAADDAEPAVRVRPARRQMRLFRQWLFLHCVVDDPEVLARGRIARWQASWTRYGHARRFARDRGPVPKMRPDWPETTFEAVSAIGAGSEDAWEPLSRSLRLKLDAHALAGAGYLGYSMISGLTALILMPAVVGWLSRLAAVARGGTSVTREDVLAGLRQTHHTFGVSPVFVSVSEVLRIGRLAQPGIPATILQICGP